jgi:hypothetical protein
LVASATGVVGASVTGDDFITSAAVAIFGFLRMQAD